MSLTPERQRDRRARYEHVRATFPCCLAAFSFSLEEARRQRREHASGQQIPAGPVEICPCRWHAGSVPFITHTRRLILPLVPGRAHTHPSASACDAHPVSSRSVISIVSAPGDHGSSVLTCTTCASGSGPAVRRRHGQIVRYCTCYKNVKHVWGQQFVTILQGVWFCTFVSFGRFRRIGIRFINRKINLK